MRGLLFAVLGLAFGSAVIAIAGNIGTAQTEKTALDRGSDARHCPSPGQGSREVAELVASEPEFARHARVIEPAAVLRQIDINWVTGTAFYSYTSEEVDRELFVERTIIGEFTTVAVHRSPLLSWFKPFDLRLLRIGPDELAPLMQEAFPQATVTSMTAYPDPQTCEVIWRVFASVRSGVVSATFRNSAGAFSADLGGRAFQPPPCTNGEGEKVEC